MKTVIVVEDSKVTVQVDNGAPVLVEPTAQQPSFTEPIIKETTEVADPPKPSKMQISGNRPDPDCGYCRKRGSACKRHGGSDSQTYQHRRKSDSAYNAPNEKQKAWNSGEGTDDQPRLAETAPPAKHETISKCHDAKVKVVGTDEGTNHYECLACGQACDIKQQLPPFHDRWNCGACREAGRPCRLHAELEAEGKQPPRFGL